MKSERVHIPLQSSVSSLCWAGDALIDWVNGGCVFGIDGKVVDGHGIYWGYRFDAVVQSASGRYAVIYERLGTKALLLDRGKRIRELNRSYYCAEAYEYPVVLFEHPHGRALLAHCPEEYNRIEIDDVVTGDRLTRVPDRKPEDFFHSRLAVSPGNTRLLSAGWTWHPVDSVCTWPIADVLSDGRALDMPGPPEGVVVGPISGAVFVDEDRILICSNAQDAQSGFHKSAFLPGSLAVFNLKSNSLESIAPAEETVGTMMWLGDGLAVGFYGIPRVFDVATGRIVHRWPDIATGTQCSSIHPESLPAIACDPGRKRFAVGSERGIEVVLL